MTRCKRSSADDDNSAELPCASRLWARFSVALRQVMGLLVQYSSILSLESQVYKYTVFSYYYVSFQLRPIRKPTTTNILETWLPCTLIVPGVSTNRLKFRPQSRSHLKQRTQRTREEAWLHSKGQTWQQNCHY
jgi:hypothetical protein